MTAKLLNILLQRSDGNIPWGFGISGGKDQGHHPIISYVSTSTLAAKHLNAGDKVLEIEKQDASRLLHCEIEEMLNKKTKSIELTVEKLKTNKTDENKRSSDYQTLQNTEKAKEEQVEYKGYRENKNQEMILSKHNMSRNYELCDEVKTFEKGTREECRPTDYRKDSFVSTSDSDYFSDQLSSIDERSVRGRRQASPFAIQPQDKVSQQLNFPLNEPFFSLMSCNDMNIDIKMNIDWSELDKGSFVIDTNIPIQNVRESDGRQVLNFKRQTIPSLQTGNPTSSSFFNQRKSDNFDVVRKGEVRATPGGFEFDWMGGSTASSPRTLFDTG